VQRGGSVLVEAELQALGNGLKWKDLDLLSVLFTSGSGQLSLASLCGLDVHASERETRVENWGFHYFTGYVWCLERWDW